MAGNRDHSGFTGRGALRNVRGRFDVHEVVPVDDDEGEVGGPQHVDTVVTPERSKSIIARNDSPDVPFDRSINPYKGCEHGCVYCFARATHAYLGLSPGLDFETRIFYKPAGPRLLRAALRKPSYRCRPIALGTNTDPYQPVERRLRLTRALLEVLAEHRHPFSVVTKSAMVLRDLDILEPMARQGLTAVYLSVTTLDARLARDMEPRASTPYRRLQAIETLSRAGVPTGVLASPIIPGLNDAELEAILRAASRAGTRRAGYILVRLPHEVREVFTDWLERRYPTKSRKVLGHLAAMQGQRLCDPRFGLRQLGQGPFADLLRRRFEIACRRFGLSAGRRQLDCTQFRVPPARGVQAGLFD